MAELQPDEKVEGPDLAVMGVAAKHQINITVGLQPDRGLMHQHDVETVSPV